MPREIYYIGPETQPPRPRQNGLGIAAFVVSLGSLLTCGLASPVGLLLSLAALLKRPRGWALAGLVISGLQTAMLAAVVGGVISTGQAIQERSEYAVHAEKTREAMAAARETIEEHRVAEGHLPAAMPGLKLVVQFEDSWGEALRYELRDEGYLIRSAGPDGRFETPDDLTLGEPTAESPPDAAAAPDLQPFVRLRIS